MGPEPEKAPAPPPPPRPSIKVETLAEGTYCLYGRGGNIGVVATPGAVLMVDTQYDALAPAIQEEIGKLSPAAIRYVVNTQAGQVRRSEADVHDAPPEHRPGLEGIGRPALEPSPGKSVHLCA
jgi:hypothetical protein